MNIVKSTNASLQNKANIGKPEGYMLLANEQTAYRGRLSHSFFSSTNTDSTISRITDKILPIVKEWQERPLEEIYAVVFMDAIHYHVRNEGRIVKRAVYIAIGIDMEGHKDVLGMYVGQNESAKFWLSILNGLKNRGVEDILIACVDGLTGFPQAIEAVFPDTEIQHGWIWDLHP